MTRKRDKVRVDGTIYASIAKAFIALGLPFNRHQVIRRELKQKRKLIYRDYEFEIVE